MAANTGPFIGWNLPVAGREQAALDDFSAAVEFFGQQQTAGQIESFETVMLSPHGGNLNGFVLIRGDGAKLSELRWSEEIQNLLTRAQLNISGMGVVFAAVGDGVAEQMARYRQALGGWQPALGRRLRAAPARPSKPGRFGQSGLTDGGPR